MAKIGLTHADVETTFPTCIQALCEGDPIPSATRFWLEDNVLWAEDTMYNHRVFWDRPTRRWVEEGGG